MNGNDAWIVFVGTNFLLNIRYLAQVGTGISEIHTIRLVMTSERADMGAHRGSQRMRLREREHGEGEDRPRLLGRGGRLNRVGAEGRLHRDRYEP